MSAPRNDGTGPDRRWAVPLRRVFPWWFLVGAVVTGVVVSVVATGSASGAVITLWGPLIGITIREREKRARERIEQGRAVDRRSLVGPVWIEPVVTIATLFGAVGLAFLLGALFDSGNGGLLRTRGDALLGGAALVGVAALLWAATVLVGRHRTAVRDGAAPTSGDAARAFDHRTERATDTTD